MDDRKIVAWGEGHNSWVIVSPALNFLSAACQILFIEDAAIFILVAG
jgi:hypothetical protein